jgi:hypothetical protein
MTSDISQVLKIDYEQLKCKHCLKVIGWDKCICDQWAKCLLESICAECYLQKIVNSVKYIAAIIIIVGVITARSIDVAVVKSIMFSIQSIDLFFCKFKH